MSVCCTVCMKHVNFLSNQAAEAAGWDIQLEQHWCSDHACKHDFIYAVIVGRQVHFGVMEVNNLHEANAKLKDKFPEAKRFHAFYHIGEEQEEVI